MKKYPHATFGAQSEQSDAPTKNHLSDHIDAANVAPAKGKSTMASIYDIEKQVETILVQTRILCEIMGIDPIPMPNETLADEPTIEELTDPDA
jgi:hypothetical protein